MSELEKIINNNMDAYDSEEPAEGHFERFENKLSELHHDSKSENAKVIQFVAKQGWKIAAAVVILIGVGFVFFNVGIVGNKDVMTAQDTEIILSPELTEVEIYYASLADDRFTIIDQLIPDSMEGSMIKEMVDMELSELSENYGELLEEYKNNPDDDRIIDAIINNYRIQAEILDNIIINLNKLKNQKNETNENENVSL